MAKQTNCLLQSLKIIFKAINAIFCFIFVYVILTILIIPLIILIIYRFAISLIFKILYKGRYKLLESENGIHAPDFPNSVYTISSFLFVDGTCDIPWLREKMYKTFTETKKADGSFPYERMLCKVVKKFGFFCWESVKEKFDICHHIRPFPGCSDPKKIYSEKEIFEAAAGLADDPWEESQPRWEFLIVPQVRKEGTGEICSVIHQRVQHAYGDGVSFGLLVIKGMGDQPSAPFIFDPVNPGFTTPLYLKLLTYLQVFFFGPSVLLRFALHKERHVFYEGPLKGCKFMGRGTLPLTLEEMRRIRKHYKTSTTAIQHFALTGALQKYAERRGLPIPSTILGAILSALVPYPDYYPHNRFMMFLEKFPVGDKDPFERLSKIDKICRKSWSPTSYYIALTSRVLNRVTGILPAGLIEKLVVLIQLSYCLSNAMGVKGKIYFNGNQMKSAICVGPLLNGMRFVVGVGCYDQNFEFGFQTEKCELIKNRDDLLELITDFENEIKFLSNGISNSRIKDSFWSHPN